MSMEDRYAPLPQRNTVPDVNPDSSTVLVVPRGITAVVQGTIQVGSLMVEVDDPIPSGEIHLKQRGLVVAKITNIAAPSPMENSKG
jgi:hypothetical protein